MDAGPGFRQLGLDLVGFGLGLTQALAGGLDRVAGRGFLLVVLGLVQDGQGVQLVTRGFQCGFGFGNRGLLALHILDQAAGLALQPGLGLCGGLVLGFHAGKRDAGLAELGAGHGFGLAQGADALPGFKAAGFGQRSFTGQALDLGFRGFQRGLGVIQPGLSCFPFQMGGEGFQRLDFLAQRLVFARLAGLAAQALQLALDLCGHFGEAFQIGLGGAQLQLGLMAAGVEPRNAGGFFQDAAAVLRLGGDQFRDLALPDKRGGVRAGRGVGEQELDVLAAHRAAIELVGRARAALQFAQYFQDVGIVEFGRGAPVSIVQHQRDLGGLARWPAIGTGEDEIVHLPAAHGARRGGAHHPAQGFQQVGLAAAIGADNAGQPRLDKQVLGINKGFEAGDTEFRNMHAGSAPIPVRTESPRRHRWRAFQVFLPRPVPAR